MLLRLRLYHVSVSIYVDFKPVVDDIPVRCFGAASAKDHLDIAVREAINAGSIPGPRSLANAREIAKTDGELSPDISFMADNVDG